MMDEALGTIALSGRKARWRKHLEVLLIGERELTTSCVRDHQKNRDRIGDALRGPHQL